MKHKFTNEETEQLREECRRHVMNGGEAPRVMEVAFSTLLGFAFKASEAPCTIFVFATDDGGFSLDVIFRSNMGAFEKRRRVLIPVEMWLPNLRGRGLEAWNFGSAFIAAEHFLWNCAHDEQIASYKERIAAVA